MEKYQIEAEDQVSRPLLRQKCHHGSKDLDLNMVNKEAEVKEDCISLEVHKAEVDIEVEGTIKVGDITKAEDITKEEDITKAEVKIKVEAIEAAITNKVNITIQKS